MKYYLPTLSALLGAFVALCSAPIALCQEDDEPTPPKKTRKAKDEAEEDSADLAAVPAALKDKKFVLPAKLNTKAKVYFIYMSRSTCGICVAEAPEIASAYKSMKGKKAEIVMLNLDTSKAAAEKWAKDQKMKFPIVAPGEKNGIPFPYTIENESQSLLPHMVAVDAEGNKLAQANGGDVAAFIKDWKKVVKNYEREEKKATAKAKREARKAGTDTADDEE